MAHHVTTTEASKWIAPSVSVLTTGPAVGTPSLCLPSCSTAPSGGQKLHRAQSVYVPRPRLVVPGRGNRFRTGWGERGRQIPATESPSYPGDRQHFFNLLKEVVVSISSCRLPSLSYLNLSSLSAILRARRHTMEYSMSYSPWWWVALAASPFFLFFGEIVYNVFFHPLRRFPGPPLARATGLWRAYKEVILKETLARELFDLHKKYGKSDFNRTRGLTLYRKHRSHSSR